jgi:hypothetical protein
MVWMVRMLVMLSRGFFSNTSRSAALPLASVPNSFSMPRASEAPFEVVLIGVALVVCRSAELAGSCDREELEELEMKISVWVLSALLLASSAIYAQDPAKPPKASIEDIHEAPRVGSTTDNFNRVARIFGRDIFLLDLNPTDEELTIIRRGRKNMEKTNMKDNRSEDQVISDVRSHKLAGLIWDPIWAEFGRTHDVKPTESEINDQIRSMESFNTKKDPNPLADDPRVTPKMKKEIEREIAEHFVAVWKRSKALYEEYGGVVLWTQFNPLEPFGAMRKLLEHHEAKGDFEIYDEQLKQEFWKYYLREPTSWKILKPDQIDYSQPWWLKTPSDAGK